MARRTPLIFELELIALCTWPRRGLDPLLLKMLIIQAHFAWRTRILEMLTMEMPLDAAAPIHFLPQEDVEVMDPRVGAPDHSFWFKPLLATSWHVAGSPFLCIIETVVLILVCNITPL
jgi:hypothetical protein